MNDWTLVDRNILLIADPRSPAALRVSQLLHERGFRVERVAPGQPASGLQLASVFLLEAAVTPKLLRGLLGCVQTPVLVLAATRELAADVLPLLRSDDDVARLDEVDSLAAWRLQRLIDRACGSGPRRLRLDSLTALLARHAFEQQVAQTIAKLHPDDVVALLLVNLDRFKTINDRKGHDAGDRALRRVADAIRGRLPAGDFAARLEGDEFAVLMRRADKASLTSDARQLLEAIGALELGGPPDAAGMPSVSASGGLVFVTPDDRPGDLLVDANIAIYEAKTEGRGRLVLHRDLVERMRRDDVELKLRHLENSKRRLTERLVDTLSSKSRRLIEEANRKANVCPLTGVYSKGYLMTQLPREIEEARTRCRPLAVAMVDVDKFGEFNRSYSFATGDRVLQAFAAVASESLRSTDWIGRWGGDDFLFVMPGTSLEDARRVIDRVRAVVGEKTIESTDGRRLGITVSAGVTELRPETVDAVALTDLASDALNRAKRAGRNRVEAAG